MPFQILPLSYALGAEIKGIDLRKPLDDQTFNEVNSAFLEHCVLLFRGQPLTQKQHIAFSRRFGELTNNDVSVRDRHPEYPEILLNTNKPQRGGRPGFGYAAALWHADGAFSSGRHCVASLLRSINVPEIGGDTMFSNMYLAYDTLSEGMKKLIAGLYSVHFGRRTLYDESTPERLAETKRLNPPIAHPLVRVPPETGRKALYMMERVKQLVGMTVEESKPLIQFLCNYAARPQFVYRHQWRNDDLIMWDNRCTNHIALGDFDRTRFRNLERTTVYGTTPLGEYVIPEDKSDKYVLLD